MKKSEELWWRSLRDRTSSPELLEESRQEFAEDASLLPDSFSRRRFMQIMGASAALAGMTGCRWPKEKILPYSSRPAGQEPGNTQAFASSMDLCGVGRGLLASSFEGRPIKIEGNPEHPASLGAADSFAQASVLQIYDPDRSQHLRYEGEDSDWDSFLAFARPHFAGIREARGKGLAILSNSSSSLSREAFRSRLQKELPEALWLDHEPLSRETQTAGLEIAYGKRLRAQFDLSHAERIVCLDEDLFGQHPDALHLTRSFSRFRRAEEGSMNRLYVLEPAFTMTGGMADHRKPLKVGEVDSFLHRLASLLGVPGFAHGKNDEFLQALADDLLEHRGKSLLCAGPRQPARVHALLALLNEKLGNVGKTLHYTEEFLPPSDSDSLRRLQRNLKKGRVSTLLILSSNPAYDAPRDLLPDLSKASTIHLGLYQDETAQLCDWHLPEAHYLESWGSSRTWDGTASPVQPLIEPLYGGKTQDEILSILFGEELDDWQLCRDSFGREMPESRWQKALHDGLLAGSESSPVQGKIREKKVLSAQEKPSHDSGLELVFSADASVLDGRFSNLAWLQETPDPVSKLTWDNAALLSPSTAAQLGIKDEDLLALELDGRSLKVAAMLVPGVAEDSVILPLGYGRRNAGRVGDGVGFDSYALRSSKSSWYSPALLLSKAGGKYKLALTQDHWMIDKLGFEERARRLPSLIRQGDLKEYQEHPDFARHMDHHPPLDSLWKEHEYPGHRWGMAIDLNSCTGCSACTVACQAENNIPVVGKAEVRRGREMSWIRMDRYFRGDLENPEMGVQPVACTHCELAPCEAVCPVGATAHSDEGLNDMAYNRCIGTRYCGNNCPFKVRRFNWFGYSSRASETEKMAYNPDVSVRGRGVMEKCSYCVQRIESARAKSKVEGRELRDGDVTPACAQTCPAEAIVFGDLNDRESRVFRLHENPRSYALFGELNLKSRTAYLARLKNPNPALVHEQGDQDGHHHG
ncbi:MAG: TAT-variant-translocated molybdopterin oxidoreductase [Candidatus Krumholzibacteria bacterium]|nr:TAT-variant-translocated molybdopterin oxidoreductase [Candidatus Krumholzibacteria bacterium]